MALDDLDKGVLTSYLVSFFLNCLFFGIFFVTYAITIWLLVFNGRRRRGQSRRRDLAQAGLLSVMLALALAYMLLDVAINVKAFAGADGDLSTTLALFDVTNRRSLWGPKLSILVTQTLLADGYLVYRLYVVWSRSLTVIIAPVLFLICEAAFGYTTVHYQVHPEASPPSGTHRVALPGVMTILCFSSSLITNLLSTGLIAGRIIRSNRRVREFRLSGCGAASQRSCLVDIVVQSAAIYSGALVVVLIAMFTATAEPLVVLGILPSLAGAVFSLVIIRTRLSDATSPEAQEVDLQLPPRLPPPQRIGTGLSIMVSREVISCEDTK
ncbi:hypothetical protein C8Q77DRAFT_835684 [Trametes polyzona]|nr:hypothetical protein C8Q77DRAFT_835684 [Trametes polyzona]